MLAVPHLIIVFLLSASGATPHLKVGLCVSARGMDAGTVSATREKITGEIGSLGAEVVSTSSGEECCTTPECLRDLQHRGIAGLAEISILRFGSVIRINMRFYSAASQKQILHIKAKASAANFPASASLKSVMKRGIESLRPKPLVKKPKEEPVSEVVPPPPDLVRPPVIVSAKEDRDDSTWYWIGGSLAAGGAILAGVGIYFFMGPMQDAIDRRDRAHDNWLLATEPDEIERYRSEMKDQDDKASSYHTLGWVGTGVGAAMVVGGLLVMLLVPDSETAPSVRPLALRSGGGFILQWSFQ
jgi:hypothetical protein